MFDARSLSYGTPYRGRRETDRRLRQIASGRLKPQNRGLDREVEDALVAAVEGAVRPFLEEVFGKPVEDELVAAVEGAVQEPVPPTLGEILDNALKPLVEAIKADLKFRTGDRVTWTSSNTEKQGTVVGIVPAGSLPADVGFKVKDASIRRDHLSFVIDTGARLYWPRVSLLKKD